MSGLTSDYILKKLMQQYDLSVVRLADAMLEQPDRSESWKWEVRAHNQRFVCNDIEWECTSAFHVSTKLPCQHIMLVARIGHGFNQLPGLTLAVRWSLDHAAVLSSVLMESVTSIRHSVSAVEMS